jgi:CubicO group peptidase (beta-lactamase class C family)
LTSTIYSNIDALFKAWNRTDSPGCVLGIVQKGQFVYQRAYGMADLEREVTLKSNAVFDIGSTGKQFTAMLIALLAEQGLLSLDDPVHKYVPELPQYEQPITIRHLIYHTSGLRDYLVLLMLSGKSLDVSYTTEELLTLICRQQHLNFLPGEEFLYSNTGYLLMGVIAARVTNTLFPDLLRKTFFEPLGMTASDVNDDLGRVTRNRALSYSPDGNGCFRNEIPGTGGLGDGPVLSNLQDLLLWDQNFYDNRLGGGSALIEQMYTSGRFNNGDEIGYGFGLFVSSYRGLPVISHGGAWAGYRSELMRFPEQQCSIICLANLGSMSPSQLVKQVADIYLAEVLAKESDQSAEDVTVVDLSPYTGFYQNPRTRSIFELKISEGEPIALVSGYPMKLAPSGERQWRVTNVPYVIHLDLSGESADTRFTMSNEFSRWRPETYHKLDTSTVGASLNEAEGTYRSDELDTLYTLSVDGEQLSLKVGMAAPVPLQHICRDTFLYGPFTLELIRDANNRISAIDVCGDRVRSVRIAR